MDLTAEQFRFLRLHARHTVTKWRWFWLGDSLLRAYTDNGRTATITREELEPLVDLGFVAMLGCAGVRLTAAGMELVK